MNRQEIMGLRKAAIVLQSLADSMPSKSANMLALETLMLAECVAKAANELENVGLASHE